MKYFTSDLHFGDKNSLIVDRRPFKSIKQFDKSIIKNWNKQAKKEDEIYVIGDFIDCDGEGDDTWRKTILYVKRVKARVILIVGNNEKRVIKYYFDDDFEKFRDYCLSIGFYMVKENMIVEIENQKFYLTHKPKDYSKDYLNLFGHVHRSSGIYKSFGFNVGCDIHHYKLVSETDIHHYLKLKNSFWDEDINVKIL